MEAQELLEKLINEIEQVKLIDDFKNDNTNHVNNVIAYYSRLKKEYANTPYFKTATDTINSLNGENPALSTLAKTLINKERKQETPINKEERAKGQTPIDAFSELLKAIKSTIVEHHKQIRTGMQDTNECEQYISILRQYQMSLNKYKDRLNPNDLTQLQSFIEKEIQVSTDIIEYAKEIETGHTLIGL